MARYSSYGQNDSQMLDDFDTGFFGFNNRFRPDQLKTGILADSRNGRMDLNGEWQVRKGIEAVSNVLITPGTGLILPFTLNNSNPPTIDDSAQPRIWGSCAFSNPNDTSGQYLIVALNNKVSATNLSTQVSTSIEYPNSYILSKSAFLLQAFEKVILFTGGQTALEWDGQFDLVDADDLVIGKNYKINVLGTTNWNTVAGTSGETYSVGDTVIVEAIDSGTDGKAYSAFTKVPSGSLEQPKELGDSSNNTVINDGEATVTVTAHGLIVGDDIVVTKTGNGLTEGDRFKVATVTDADTFKFFVESSNQGAQNITYTKPVSEGIGLIRMPAPDFGTYHSNRLAVPYAYNVESTVDTFTDRGIRDEIIISNGNNTNIYDDLRVGAFRLNQGTADFIVGLHSFSEDRLLVFNRNSIYAISGTNQLKTATTSLITNEVGCVARDSIVQVGDTMLFLSDNGVYGASFQDLYNLRGNEVPLSESINKYISKLNRNYWDRSSAVYFDNKYYIAVPYVSPRMNVILIYNFINKQWESLDFTNSLTFNFEKLILAGDKESRGVYVVNSFGGVHKLEERIDGRDRLADDPSGSGIITTYDIPASMETRQYTLDTVDRKKWNTFEINLESSPERRSDFDLSVETENIDYSINLGRIKNYIKGQAIRTGVPQGEDASARGRIGNCRAYGLQYKINNIYGRPKIKSIKTTGSEAFRSTNKAI